eukprot:TRINITY_DN18314_c0_g1_i1.p1 TRINITY_DN18314_c0_g1~~TRINITY_DN18314_c0_g1_i1.p1  ORF type:complete len:178 (-),score=44.25 TRINITY_DN18314_c0_g1_i1:127-636(-)
MGVVSRTGTHNVMLTKALSLLLVLVASDAQKQKSRHPRLFLVSSSSTTSTLSPTTLCYATANTGFTTTACGRKKRAIYTDPVTGKMGGLDLDDVIQPQEPLSSEENSKDADLIESGRKEYEREGKFLLYWMTTTTTSTSTTYTATTTLSALECTPSGFGISQCPSNGKK